MKKLTMILFAVVILFATCKNKKEETQINTDAMNIINDTTITGTIEKIVSGVGDINRIRVEKGVNQVARFWKAEDGTDEDFMTFCTENFVSDTSKLKELFEKTSYYFEILFGNFSKMNIELKRVLHLEMGEISQIDLMFGSYNPASHLNDDLFSNKIAHNIILNFPFYTLEEKEELGKDWTREQWAYARMGDAFTSRTPASILLKSSEISTLTDNYIAEYNIVMQNLRDKEGNKLFENDLKLISHWGLRDELKSNYSKGDTGLKRQELIYEVMKNIVTQNIPKDVINNEELIWNPYTNKVFRGDEEITCEREPDTRYEHLLNNFRVLKEIDEFSPYYPTYIKRAFEEDLELRQEFVESLFIELVSSEQAKKTGQFISQRLGRPLQPFDIWYDGFKMRSSINEDDLTRKLQAKYPNVQAYERDISSLLVKLGFTNEKANEIASKIVVEGARGAGHAWGAEMKSEKAHLRTRMAAAGMDYKGYNIAMHELGHNVEQTITLHDVDYYMLKGVPNTAYTEAMAFMFQTRDLELMGIRNTNPDEKYYQNLDIFWGLYEIMGVSLVDMSVWKWLYENPEATPEQLKNQVVIISKEIWNKYYAPVFGVSDSPILGIYSHMIAYPLYLSAYPLGHLIQFQIEEYIKNNNANFATEMQRMLVTGSIVPQAWMLEAVHAELSNQPMLKAVDEALNNLNNR
ncbi:MAG: hypothetical protein PHT69_04755 [Bacteroidales bacterium]|nr:hypothetical protein [Bacteroidales bacterium]